MGKYAHMYEILARFLEHQQAVCAVLFKHGGDRVLIPSPTEFSVIEELVDILTPLMMQLKYLVVICILQL